MNKSRLFGVFCAAVFSLVTLSSYAATVTISYTATIIDIAPTLSSFSVGETIGWQLTYNDSGTYATVYNDGQNTIAEQGAGDDTLKSQSCVDWIGPNCTSAFINSIVVVMSDATFDIGGILATLKGDRISVDAFTDNWSYMWSPLTDPQFQPVPQFIRND